MSTGNVPYTSIVQTVTAQPQPENVTFLPFQRPPEPKPVKPCKCCIPCCFIFKKCRYIAEVCFVYYNCRDL